MTINDELEEYLNLFKVSEKKYLVGIFQGGITVYRQQIRALNILYALYETKKIKKGDTIALIGGGVAGLTIAAAAAKIGLEVTLYEKKSKFLNMQYGCDTRKIHPNIYEWPSPNSLFPYADIPILSWKYGTASDVSKQIFYSYKKIREEIKFNNANRDKIYEIKNCTSIKIKEIDKKGKISIKTENSENLTKKFDLVIFATGYGIEDGIKETPSYWRNDDYSQLSLEDKKQEILITGAGDGGLIDLFRFKIFGFSFDSILSDLGSQKESYDNLTEKLVEIKKEWLTNSSDCDDDWLHDKFEGLYRDGYLDYLENVLNEKKDRVENNVYLNSNNDSFEEVLNLNKISLMNALIAFYLYKKKKFTYVGGNYAHCISGSVLSNKKNDTNIKKIIRHGTGKDEVLTNVSIQSEVIAEIKEKQYKSSEKIPERKWPVGWWSTQFTLPKDLYKPSIEFLTHDTQSVCSSFISVLSKVVEYFHEKGDKKDFRVVLHRVVKIQSDFYFQQITRYFGTRTEGEVGRVFPITGGAVGYSVRTGNELLAERKDGKEDEFDALWSSYNMNINARVLPHKVSSIFTIPILGLFDEKEKANAPNLILYIDSSSCDFFSDEIMQIIIKSTQGFIESIDKLIDDKQIIMGELDFNPVEIQNHDLLLDQKISEHNSYKRSLTSKLTNGENYSLLSFKKFHSFNVIFENENDPFD